MGGLLNIIKNFQVGKIILPKIDLKKITASWYKNLMKELNNGCHQLEFAQKDKIVNLDDVEIKIISDSTYNGNNVNNYSMVLKITYG